MISRQASATGSGWLLCPLALAVCVLITRPYVEMGVTDDWSYIRTAQIFAASGHLVYNGYATAMLGWQIALGALFIKLFGFSFTIVRASVFCLSLLTAALIQRIFLRCGLHPWNATLGTLALILSPLFLPLSFSFMSDVPGLFCIAACLYCCLRAFQARGRQPHDPQAHDPDPRPGFAIAWLLSAAAASVLLGTVRQISWLGALVLVPSTAWLLRKQRSALWAGALAWLASGVGIFLLLHWFYAQPYALPEKLLPPQAHLADLQALIATGAKASLALALFLLPVLLAFVPRFPWRSRRAQLFAATAIALCLAFAMRLHHLHLLSAWLQPALGDYVTKHGLVDVPSILGERPVVLGLGVRSGLTAVTLVSAIAFLASLLFKPSDTAPAPNRPLTLHDLTILLGPFLVAYLALLVPRAVLAQLLDRYLLPLLFILLIATIRLYQDRVAERLPALTVLAVALFAAYGVAAMHDFFAMQRARLAAADQLRAAGIPRTAIRGGFEYDGTTQLDAWGYINDDRLINPPGAHQTIRPPVDWQKPLDYLRIGFPAVVPRYVLSFNPAPGARPTPFPPTPYRTWLPPHTGSISIQPCP